MFSLEYSRDATPSIRIMMPNHWYYTDVYDDYGSLGVPYLCFQISETSSSPRVIRRLGYKPRRNTKPRINGESDTFHCNLKGAVRLGPTNSTDFVLFGGLQWEIDRSPVTFHPDEETNGLVLVPGVDYEWQSVSWLDNVRFFTRVDQIDDPRLPSRCKGYIISYNRWYYTAVFAFYYDPSTLYGRLCYGSYGTTWYTNDPEASSRHQRQVSMALDDIFDGTWTEPLGDWFIRRMDGSLSPIAPLSKYRNLLQSSALIDKIRSCLIVDEDARTQAFEDMAQDACAAFRPVEANALSTLMELRELRGGIEGYFDGLKEIAKNARHPGKLLQSLGNFRLSWKWGIPLTVKDAREIANAFTDDLVYGRIRDRWQSSRVRRDNPYHVKAIGCLLGSEVDVQLGLKAIVSKYDNRTTSMLSAAFDYNFLSLSNLWDMIPYSFVVDWVTNVDDRIALVDDTLYKQAFLDVRGCVCSTKYSFRINTRQLERLIGQPVQFADLECTLFTRDVLSNLPWPTLNDRSLSSNVGFIQYLDGATLILQRVRLT